MASAQGHKEFVDETDHIPYLFNPCIDIALGVFSILAPFLSLILLGIAAFLIVTLW